MTDLPAPLTPHDCDLSSLDWFPFYFRKLRRSGFWLNSSAEVRAISVELWCEAIQQAPAASLPDSDVALSDAAGFGRFAIDQWTKHKANVMKAWVFCSDGRWYHPYLSLIALETFLKRLGERSRKATAAGHKAKERMEEVEILAERVRHYLEHGDFPTEKAKASAGKTPPSGVTGDDKTGDDSTGDDSPPLPPKGDDFDLLGDQAPKVDLVKDAFKAFQTIAREYDLPFPESLTDARRKNIKARIKDHGPEAIQRMIDAYSRSRFLRGEEGRDGWKGAVIDWAFRPTNFQKIIEGNYDDKPGKNGNGGPRDRGPGAGRGSIYDDP